MFCLDAVSAVVIRFQRLNLFMLADGRCVALCGRLHKKGVCGHEAAGTCFLDYNPSLSRRSTNFQCVAQNVVSRPQVLRERSNAP